MQMGIRDFKEAVEIFFTIVMYRDAQPDRRCTQSKVQGAANLPMRLESRGKFRLADIRYARFRRCVFPHHPVGRQIDRRFAGIFINANILRMGNYTAQKKQKSSH